jgi:hypothetical protein
MSTRREDSMTRTNRAFALVCVCALALPTAARCADQKPSIEPAAAATLTAALERIAGAQRLSFRVETASDTVLPEGGTIQYTGVLEIAVRRPDGLLARYDGEQRRTRSWYDGKVFTHLDVDKNTYARWQAPPKLEELLSTMKEKLGFTPPLSHLLREDIVKTALGRVRTGFTAGRGTVGGVPCRHLVFRFERSDWEVWIAEEGPPIFKRLVITYKLEPGTPRFTATFLAWDFDPAPANFTFAAPAGAIQCEFERPAK